MASQMIPCGHCRRMLRFAEKETVERPVYCADCQPVVERIAKENTTPKAKPEPKKAPSRRKR